MSDVPGNISDLFKLFRKHLVFGDRVATVFLYVVVVVVFLGLAAAAITFSKIIYAALPGSVPVDVEPRELITLGIVGALVVAAYAVIGRRLKKIERLTASTVSADHLSDFAKNADVVLDGRLKMLDDRVKYLESEVGDQLVNMLVEQQLKTQGLTRGPLLRHVERLPPTPEIEANRLKSVQFFLFEAARAARDYASATTDFEKVAQRQQLLDKIRAFVGEYLAFNQFANVENLLDLHRLESEKLGKHADPKDGLEALAGYLEAVIPQLTVKDLQPEKLLPPSFEHFIKN